MGERPQLSIVIPVYQSQDCLPALYTAIVEITSLMNWSYEIIFVNDFSPDGSWSVIESLCELDRNVVGIDLRRNFGQDNAILTGLRAVRGEYVAIMDDDLQHHPKFLPALMEEIAKGHDVVYADFRDKKQKRWKNIGSWINGKIAEWVLDKPKGMYISPYKVIRRAVVELICEYPGHAPYIDGLLFQTTARFSQIPAQHYSRHYGSGNFTFSRSVGVSARLAFSFSSRPLRIIGVAGLFFSTLGLALAAFVVSYRLLLPNDFGPEAVGWASLMVAVLIAAGLQLICFGAMAEYIGRSYLLMSRKPQSAIREILGHSYNRRTIDTPATFRETAESSFMR
jgi:glycosyltransferase involved in cell wall biosynthesis